MEQPSIDPAALTFLTSNKKVGLAIFDWDTLFPKFENTLFKDWFPIHSEEPVLTARFAKLKIDRIKKRALKGTEYSLEQELKRNNRSKIIKVTFSRTEAGDLLVHALDYTKEKEVEYLLDSYVKMAEVNKKDLEESLLKIKAQKEELIRTNADLERERNSIELRALQAVINPHFVSNCLASIQRFIVDNNTEMSVNYLSHFGKLMRMSFEQSYNDYVAISDILHLLNTYASIEKIRIDHEWELIYAIDDQLDVDNLKIPPLLIQPFLENAIWYGINNKKHGGKICIALKLLDEITLACSIEDNGIGREATEKSQGKANKAKLHSLNVTGKRLDILWQEHERQHEIVYTDLVDATGATAGTRVELMIPVSF